MSRGAYCKLLGALVLVAQAGCSHTVVTQLPPPPVGARVQAPVVVALLGVRDLRMQKGGVKTHAEERFQPPPPADPYYGRRAPVPMDPWSRYDPVPPPMTRPGEDVRLRATGELGVDEVAVPLLDGFAQRFEERLGPGALRDAQDDPLSEDPDATRAAAFLTSYPIYGAAVWLEVTAARAQLPDMSTLAGMLTMAACCTGGLFALAFLIPLSLDTPTQLRVRAYLVRRDAPQQPLAAAFQDERTVEARGSAGFDVDRFRADVADLVARNAGMRLAEDLANRLTDTPTSTSDWTGKGP